MARPSRKKNRLIYLDHASTTPVDPKVYKAMAPYFSRYYGNPSTLYEQGVMANKAIENSRQTIAKLLHTVPTSIIFCSGGTESDNVAVFGIAYQHQTHGKHIVSTPIEHSAVLEPLHELIKQGWEVTFVKVNKQGLVDPREVQAALRPDTVLVTVMYANNEIGSIEPIKEIGKSILRYRQEHTTSYPYFHTDACQAAGYLDLDVEKLHIDLLTLNGSKIYGPKGAGLLYVRKGVILRPLFYGGGQELKLRSGTENVPGIVGFAHALELVQQTKKQESIRLQKLIDYFWKKIQKEIPATKLNGPNIGEDRLPNNINICFSGFDAETLLLYLDTYGIMCSTGSACTTESAHSSYVLESIGSSESNAKSSLRFTFGKSNSKQDVDYVIKSLKEILKLLIA